ncbi:HAD family hydrolase [Sporosarcina sp. FSL K6-3457]|uniref:HAD family hydrolase n=1 Tax=Sporosarcina sp. FSL K6-3457 TaxID=2978204 RepID=UPI0030F6F97B
MDETQNVKAIVLDLDGTLLNSKKEVSERSIKAILEAYNKGIIVIFATARPPRSVKDFLPQKLQDIAATVYYNGALVKDDTAGYSQHYPIESAITDEIIEYVATRHPEAPLSIESEDIWYSHQILDYKNAMNTVTNPTIVPLNELKKIQASKLLITDYPYYEQLRKQFEHKVNIVCTDAGTLIQIMAKGVSKGRAIRDLCMQKNIPMSSVMAFGDDWNDLELFQACGFPIAMGNAIPELKDIAYFVTGTNDEEGGVARVLERLVGIGVMKKGNH